MTYINLESIDRVLIQRADRLGDMVLTLPVLECLKQHGPHIKIDILTSPVGASLLEHHHLIDRVYAISIDDKNSLTPFG